MRFTTITLLVTLNVIAMMAGFAIVDKLDTIITVLAHMIFVTTRSM